MGVLRQPAALCVYASHSAWLWPSANAQLAKQKRPEGQHRDVEQVLQVGRQMLSHNIGQGAPGAFWSSERSVHSAAGCQWSPDKT